MEKNWEKYRTERNAPIAALHYLNWQAKLTEQNIYDRFFVLYNTSGTNACSAVIDQKKFADFPFFADYTTYVFVTDSMEEAQYLSAYLNAPHVNTVIKPFQASGQMGERHICKKILNIPLPLFDADNPDHQELAELGALAAQKAAAFVAALKLGEDGGTLPPHQLGRLRGEIREHLGRELQAIDAALRRIWKMA